MFSIETLGLTEEDDLSEYDQEKIEKFKESIVFKNKCYYVNGWKTNTFGSYKLFHGPWGIG